MMTPIKGYSRYQIDEQGRIFSSISNRELHPSLDNNGYAGVELISDEGVSKRINVHRLVALTFIPNPNGYPIINHKDENKSNNDVSNLEWCTYKHNVNYGSCQKKIREAKERSGFYRSERLKDIARQNGSIVSKAVLQITKDGDFVARYPSGAAAARATGCDHSHIMECCNGRRYKTVGGYVWKFERSEDLLVSPF